MERAETPRTPQESLDYHRAARAIAYLDRGYRRQPTLDEVAAHVGLSPSHFQRLFTRWVGISPKQFVQQLSALRAVELLRADATVLQTAAAVGLSGGGRLHDLMIHTSGLSPGELKRPSGLHLRHGFVHTPLGELLVVRSKRGVCEARFTDGALETDDLTRRWPGADLEHDDTVAEEVAARLFGAGDAASGELSLVLRGSDFQLQVWCALVAIPAGERISYGELARGLGHPGSARAVARAVASNKLAMLIPCHRVVRQTGELSGYRWGVHRKLTLLDREREREREPLG